MRGKAAEIDGDTAALQDHPRLCGEKKHRTYIDSKIKGSPPPMRGKAARDFRRYIQYGITPAYAGKRNAGAVKRRKPKDHPRLCGEKCSLAASRLRTAGSPPPMRGKVLQEWQHLRCMGITPAYAGKSIGKEWCFLET